jgi:hypothetical protein
MSERPPTEGAVTGEVINIDPVDPIPVDPNLGAFLEVERTRIQAQDRRTDALQAAIKASDAADQRQYDFRMAQLQAHKDDLRARFRFGTRFLTAVTSVGVVCLIGLVSLAIWGQPEQRKVALDLVKLLFVAVAGWGVISNGSRFVRKFLGDSEKT